MRWIALMPLRGGSKSIPRKNLLEIAGRPLFAWSLAQAIESGCFDEIFVASDSAEIRAMVRAEFGSAVSVVERSPASATDTASSESIMLEVGQRGPFDVMCLIQATSPFTLARHFSEARAQFLAENLDSLLSAVLSKRFFWSPDGVPLNYDPAARPRRQDFAGTLIENGAFYLTRRSILLGQRCRLGGRVGIYAMPEETLLEIDEPADLEAARRLLVARGAGAAESPAG